MNVPSEAKEKEPYLDKIETLYKEIHKLDNEYNIKRISLKESLAKLIEEAKYESDMSVAEIAKHVGLKRQSVNKVLIDVYGVRYPEKSKAAKIGHTKNA